MKVLYVGPGDGSGYGAASCLHALALDHVGVDVAFRRLDLGGSYRALPPRIAELEKKSTEGVTHVIQHSLPTHMQYDGRVKCVGMFAWETDKLPPHWVRRLNWMRAVWAVSKEQARVCLESGVTRPVAAVPHPCDLSRYQDPDGPLLPELAPYKDRGDFIFYGVGEWVRRKHWSALLRAFHSEFLLGEPVQLVLKTSSPGLSPKDAHEKVRSSCQEVKRAMRLGRAREEIILTDFYSDEQMLSLHRAGDCCVSSSFAESWQLGLFDGMAMGRPVIAPATGGYLDYLDESVGWLIPGRAEPAFGAVEAPPGLYTHDESWFSLDILALRRAMREAFENREEGRKKGERGRERAKSFSWEAVGGQMVALLGQI